MRSLALRQKDLAILRAALGRFSAIREVRVFGSRATGQARRASDLDLAISAPDASAREWADICEALEKVPIIYQLDVVRPERTTSESLKENINRDGVRVYPVDESA